jgi:hypothetical protein
VPNVARHGHDNTKHHSEEEVPLTLNGTPFFGIDDQAA